MVASAATTLLAFAPMLAIGGMPQKMVWQIPAVVCLALALSLLESFLILPLGFLSGTFFTLAALPEPARLLIAFNPVFYAVDGFRYGLTGYGESGLVQGMVLLLALDLALGLVAWRLFAAGYKIKP